MTPEVIMALANLGAAGAVIIVVVLFLRSNKERDAEWRIFFTTISDGNKTDITDMRAVADRITKSLDCLILNCANHDIQAKEVKTVVTEIRNELARWIQGK